MNVKLAPLIIQVRLFLLVLIISGCTLEGKISSLESATSKLAQLSLKVQDNKSTRVLIEEGTLVLASAILDKPRNKDIPLTVKITSANGDARVDERFSNYTKTVIIPAGGVAAFLSIQSANDVIYQGSDEEFTLTIETQETEGLKQNSSSLTLVVQDNEPKPTISFLTGTQNRNEDSGTGQVSVELSNVAINTVSVRVVAQDVAPAAAGTDYNFSSQILTFAPGEVSKTVSYSVLNRPGIQLARQFKLVLTDAVNANVTINNVGPNTKEHVVTILDVDRPMLAINNVTTNEGSPAAFAVTLSENFSGPVTVNYTVVPVGTGVAAVAGTDYVAASGTLTIPANTVSVPLNVTTINNPGVCDPNKSFKVVLSNPTDAVLGQSEGIGTILDITNPSVNLSSANLAVTEGTNATVNVELSQACPTRNVSVQYSTVAGTATTAIDYSTASGATISINAGQTMATISVPTADDALNEFDETFNITLANPTNASLGGTTSTAVTILDNDVAPTVTLSSASPSVSEGGAAMNLTATLSALSGKNISIAFTVSGTATQGVDYTLTASPVSIPAGTLNVNVVLTPIEDTNYEGNEDVVVTLGAPTNATLGATTAQTVTILDNDLGSFSISGVVGASDTTVDGNLSNGVVPGFNWTSSAGANNYKISVLSNDLATVVCAEQDAGNVLTYQFTAPICTLNAGTSYRVRIRSTDGTNFQSASNVDYQFYVNASPVLGANGEGPWYVMASGTIDINAAWAASPAVGVVTDPDGDAVTFTAVGNGSLGTVTNNSTSLRYTPTSVTVHGQDSITYTITDSRGGTRTGAILINVMQPFTWTGNTSSAWNVAGNWCGTSINISKTSCIAAVASPAATNTIYFNSTCASTFTCTPTTNANVSVKGVVITSNGFTQGNGFTLTVGSDGLRQSGGIFVGSSGTTASDNITLGSAVISSGTFKATAAKMIVNGTWNLNGAVDWNHRNGTARFPQGAGVSMGGKTFFNLEAASTLDFNNETVRIENDLTVEGGYNFYLNSGTLEIVRNLNIGSLSGYGTTGSALLKVVGGPAGSVISGTSPGSIPSLIIDAGLNPVTLSGDINIASYKTQYKYLSSGTFSTSGSTLRFAYEGVPVSMNFTPGSVNYNNVVIGRANLGGDTLNVDGNLELLGGYDAYVNNGTILVKGNVSASTADGYPNVGTVLVKVIGNPSGSTISGVAGSGIPNLEIAAGANNVTLSGIINITGNYAGGLTYKVSSVGTLTTTGSTLGIAGPPNEFVPGTYTYNNVKIAPGYSADLKNATLNVGGTLTYEGMSSLNNGTINAYGDVSSSSPSAGYGLYGSVVTYLKGNSSGQTVSSDLNTSSIPNLVIDTGSNPVTFATTVSVSDSFTITSVGTLNVSGSTLFTRTGGYSNFLFDAGSGANNKTLENLTVLNPNSVLSNPLTLTGALTMNNSNFNMSGNSLSVKSISMGAPSVLTKSGGTLTVDGSVISGTGAMYGGTVNP